jgi:hypothetical protein
VVIVASAHLTDGEIERFQRRQLPAEDLVSLGDHLASCGECRKRVAARADAAASAALREALGIGTDDHIAESEIQAFVDGRLDAEQRAGISAHLAECPACAEDVRDLSEFAAEFHRSAPARSPWMYGALAAAAVLVLAIGAATMFWRGHNNPAPVASLPGTGDIAALEPADAARVRDALASGRLSLPPVLSDLIGRQGALMGTSDAPAFQLESPVATVVLGVRPTLRWTALPGSPTYIVTLQDQSTGDTINSPPLRSTEWTPERALARARTYAWQVAASADGKEVVAPRPPAPPIRFTTADAATAARLEHLPASPLVRGVLYADAGLLDDAEREFGMIGANGPGADRVDAFLAQLREARAPRSR